MDAEGDRDDEAEPESSTAEPPSAPTAATAAAGSGGSPLSLSDHEDETVGQAAQVSQAAAR